MAHRLKNFSGTTAERPPRSQLKIGFWLEADTVNSHAFFLTETNQAFSASGDSNVQVGQETGMAGCRYLRGWS